MNSFILIKEKIKKENFYNYSLNTHTDINTYACMHTQKQIYIQTHMDACTHATHM